jgi:thiamine pyrophosphokinase
MFVGRVAEIPRESPVVMRAETVLILANGVWASPERLRRVVAAADHIIAADGGYSKALAHGVHVDEVIGDLDSIPGAERKALAEAAGPVVHAFARDKDWTDLELALEHALRRDPSRIILFGVLGGRLDHALTGVHLLEKGIEASVPILLVAGDETARLVEREAILRDVEPGDRVSLIPFSDSALVTTDGLRYPLRNEKLRRAASRGVSNEVARIPVRIIVEAGLLFVIHAPKEGGSDG